MFINISYLVFPLLAHHKSKQGYSPHLSEDIWTMTVYLGCLEADWRAISAEGHKMFTVVPE